MRHSSIGRSTWLAALLVGMAVQPALAQTAPTAAQVEQQFVAAYQAKDYAKAIELGLKLCDLDANGGINPYNLACCYSLNGDKDNAIKWLQRAAEAGFADDSLLAGDPDLQAVRGEAGFKTVAERVGKNAEKQVEELKKKADKAIVEYFVPEGLDPAKPAPLIVVLHGFGGNAKNILAAWPIVAKEAGAIVIAPQAMNPTGQGFEWGGFRGTEMLVMRAIEEAQKKHNIDPKRIVLSGFSQGGLMAYAIGLKNPERFCGIIPVAGSYTSGTFTVPTRAIAAWPKVFIMVGANDQALSGNQQADKDLTAANIPHKLTVYPGVGHEFPKERDAELKKALEYVFGQ